MPKTLVAALLAITVSSASAQVNIEPHRAAADRLIDAATRDSAAHRRLSALADRFGHRFSGSQSLESAIDWIIAEMKKDGFENVRKEPVTVTHWVRGAESAELVAPRRAPIHMLGLGRSIGTPPQGITAPVLVVKSFAELRARSDVTQAAIDAYDQPDFSAIIRKALPPRPAGRP